MQAKRKPFRSKYGYWNQIRKRRSDLIAKKFTSSLLTDENNELEEIEEIVSKEINLRYPLPFDDLNRIRKKFGLSKLPNPAPQKIKPNAI